MPTEHAAVRVIDKPVIDKTWAVALAQFAGAAEART